MKKIFISYADDNYYFALKQLVKQAKSLGIFDEVVGYTYKDLPQYIKSSPLMAFQRGGGYWVWKPYIIKATLDKCSDGDIVIYADAGCKINADSNEWESWFDLLKTHKSIFFQYRDAECYEDWGRYCKTEEGLSSEIQYWTKKETLDFFDHMFNDTSYHQYHKVMGGVSLHKKSDKHIIIDEWLSLSLLYPKLLIDPLVCEEEYQKESFNTHRHDQTLLTPLVFYYKEKDNACVLCETADSMRDTAAISAVRNRLGKYNHETKFQILRRHIRSVVFSNKQVSNAYYKIKKKIIGDKTL